MPDKTEKAASTKVIKWTEEEWASVANHLFAEKGPALLSSPGLEEIRAKDVFLAQEALPEDRHRKLISIAQGFQGIRHRLAAIFEGMNEARQNDLFRRDHPEAGAATQPANAGEAGEARPEQAAVAVEREEAVASLPEQEMKKPAREKKPHLTDASNSPAQASLSPAAQAESSPPAAATEPAQATTAAAAVSPDAGGYDRPAGRRDGTSEQPSRRHEQQAARERQKPQEPRPAAEQSTQAASQPPQAATQVAAGFIEVARPFVAMVCEELAMALVRAMSGKAGEQPFSGLMRNALPQFAAPQPSANSGTAPRPERQNSQRQERAPQPQLFTTAIDSPERPLDTGEEDGSHPAEVQPLFDPKLPPSANSDFKPTIGLVGTNTRELDDLQMLYPQLRLTVVAPDAVRSADVFRQCQRIIGLREDVAPPVDELLRRLLRNRYIRISGGIGRVREQLNAWLHNPGSINAEPRPNVPRGGKGQGPGEGGGKKRHNRHLRSLR
jgi:hypothetical protein